VKRIKTEVEFKERVRDRLPHQAILVTKQELEDYKKLLNYDTRMHSKKRGFFSYKGMILVVSNEV